MGTKKYRPGISQPVSLPPQSESLAFMNLSPLYARINTKVLSFDGKYLAVKTTCPLDLRFEQTWFRIDCKKEFIHSYREIFVTNNAQTGGGEIWFAYANTDNLKVTWDDYDTRVFYSAVIGVTPVVFYVDYPPWMASVHVWLYNSSANNTNFNLEDHILDPSMAWTTSYVLQPTVAVNPGMFSYNLIEGNRLKVTVSAATGSQTLYLWLRFRRIT